MKKRLKLKFMPTAFAVLTVLFVAFCTYMLAAEHNEVHAVRGESSYQTITASLTEIEDPSAPVGIRKQYSFTVLKQN